MGTLTAFGLLPHLIFSLPAGVWLDRVRTRRRLMIARRPCPGRADRAASRSPRSMGVLAMPQLYVVGFAAGPCRSSSTCRGTRCSCRSPSATATSRRWPCSTAAARSPRSAARRSAACSSRSSVRRSRCSPTRCRSSARSSSCAGSARPNRRSKPSEGSTREQLAGRAVVRARRPDHAPDAAVGRDRSTCSRSPSSALFILYATTTLGVSPGALGLALGTGAIGAVIGAICRVADRPADRARAGLRAGLRALPGLAAADPAGRPGDVDAGDPGAALRVGVRGRARGHDPRHQRRGDPLRADARTGSAAGPAARSGSSTTASARSGRCSAGCWAGCSGSARRSSSATVLAHGRGPVPDRVADPAAARAPGGVA